MYQDRLHIVDTQSLGTVAILKKVFQDVGVAVCGSVRGRQHLRPCSTGSESIMSAKVRSLTCTRGHRLVTRHKASCAQVTRHRVQAAPHLASHHVLRPLPLPDVLRHRAHAHAHLGTINKMKHNFYVIFFYVVPQQTFPLALKPLAWPGPLGSLAAPELASPTSGIPPLQLGQIKGDSRG